MRDLLRVLQEMPVVEHAAVANSRMLEGGSAHRTLTIESDERVVTERPVPIMRVGPGFFSTVETLLIAGRDFNDADTRDIRDSGLSLGNRERELRTPLLWRPQSDRSSCRRR
jgi:hypothetical protein